MNQQQRLFSHRTPKHECDQLKPVPANSRHIIVILNSTLFSIDVIDKYQQSVSITALTQAFREALNGFRGVEVTAVETNVHISVKQRYDEVS